MNTHATELPPLPSPFGIVDPDGTEGMMHYTIRDLQDYAKAYARTAIEADRKRRGEPVGYIMPTAIKQLKAGGNAIVGGVSQGCDVAVYLAPQPAEPGGYVHTAPDDCETLYWRGQILSLNELATISTEPLKVPNEADAKHVQEFINCDGMGAVIVEGPQYSAVVRALLASYGEPAQPTEWDDFPK